MVHIIFNPAAQSGAAGKRIYALIHELDKQNIPYNLHQTAHPGHGRVLASSLSLEKDDKVLLMGGDGSVNEWINGLELPTSCALGLFPIGSGNDFARGLNLKKKNSMANLISWLKKANSPSSFLDLGEIRFTPVTDFTEVNSSSFDTSVSHQKTLEPAEHTISRRFAVSSGIGYDADVCHTTNASSLKRICNRLHIGKLAYLILGIFTIFQYKRASITLTLDHSQSISLDNMAFLSCHNLPFEGGGFPFAPSADPRDGKLNLCLITAPHRFSLVLTLLQSLLGGKHVRNRHVHLFTCQHAKISVSRPLKLHTDGEVFYGITNFELRCHPSVLLFQDEASQA